MQGERALQGHRVEGYRRAVITQVSEARIEGYEIQALERQGKRVRIQGIRSQSNESMIVNW